MGTQVLAPVVTVTLEELPQSKYGHGDQPQEEDIHHQRLAGAGGGRGGTALAAPGASVGRRAY